MINKCSSHVEKHHHKHLEYIDAGGWRKRSDVESNQPILYPELKQLEVEVDPNETLSEEESESDEILDLIRSHLGRFLTERKAVMSASDSDEGVPTVINYEGHMYDATNEDGAQESIQVENYKAPRGNMLSYPDYKREKSFSYNEYMLQTPTNIPKSPQLQAVTHHYLDKNREETFMDRSDIYTDDNHLVASYPVAEVKPQKILDLVPQEQRDKYPVEVEEITYEEYLELSKKGETFEEPLDDDDDDEYFQLYNDNMGFDSQKNSVRIKFEDLLDTNTGRPRASRWNDYDHGGFYNPAGGYVQPMKLLSPSSELHMPSVINQPIVLPDTELEGEKKSGPPLTTGSTRMIPSKHTLEDSNLRRMDSGVEEYVYVDEDPDNDIDTSKYDEYVDTQNNDNDDNEEDVETEQPKQELMEKNDFEKPSPVYVVYPHSESDVSSTSTTATTSAETATQQSTKLFDIEYDQFL